ncbi:MAG: TetR/AcrR family transcriptional regulator [Clostridia bacterium]|nr:TetR/AcrR family transcriptional regulator [Clostridia bacterium]
MDRRIKKTNTAIYKAYLQAKNSHPETEPSVKEICAIADINKTTFYRYYTDIDELSRAVISAMVNKLLIENIEIEKVLTEPESYFSHVLKNFKEHENQINAFIAHNHVEFIFEAERLLKIKLKEAAPDKYDEILYTFIAGGAAHYFLSENYNDENELQKFCSIIKAVTVAYNK